MEIKRATELVLCDLLTEALPDLTFFPSKGGGDDVTPIWLPNHYYMVGDVLRPSNLTMVHAVVISAAGTSGPTEPAFTDVPDSIIPGPPTYFTVHELAVSVPVDTGYPIPPFAAVLCEPSEKMISYEDTNIMSGSLLWITKFETHVPASNVVYHSQNAKRIYDALKSITSGYDILRRLTIHGVDISGTNDFTDSERNAHGDVIEFVVAVTAKPIQV
jgi:hypothetical protein